MKYYHHLRLYDRFKPIIVLAGLTLLSAIVSAIMAAIMVSL
jgi:hypothetical protein